MQEFLKWLAGIGDEALPPSESLKFEFLAVPQGGFGLAMLLGFLLVSVGIFLIYRRDAARLSFRRRTTLAVLRFLALVSVALVLLEPSLVRIRRVVRPGEVLLLLDSSQSMGHRDGYARSGEWEEAWRAVGAGDPAELSRLDLARKLLGPEGCIRILAEKNLVRPYLFGAGLRVAPVAESQAGVDAAGKPEAGGLPPAPRLELEKILASDGSTNLSASIRQAMEASRETRIPAVVLISDGRKNVGGSLEEIGAYLRRRKVENVLIVGVGDPAEARIISVKDLQAAERIFKGDPVKVSALVGADGYDETNVQLELWEIQEKEPKLLARTTAGVGGELGTVEVEFPAVRLETEGTHLLQVEVHPPDGSFDEERHAKRHRIQVLADKLRVLLLAGSPSHEYRILRNQLIRDDMIEVACWLQSADPDFPQDGNIELKELPRTAKDLDRYDVVVLVDPSPGGGKPMVSPAPPRSFVQNLAKAVTQRGTGLWWVMGEKFSLAAVRTGSPLTALIGLLPVEPDLAEAERRIGYGYFHKKPWSWTLTPEGREHRICRLLPDPVVNATLWSKLPGHYFAFPVLRPKPAAQVLMRHEDPRLVSRGGSWPMLAVQYVGAGRVLYSGTDETHRWFGVAERFYNEFWVKGLRFLYEGKLAGGSSRFRLGISAEQITLGEEIEIYLRALDETFEPLAVEQVRVLLSGPAKASGAVDLQPSRTLEGRFTGRFRPSRLGSWQVAVHRETESNGNSHVPVSFEVVRSELESRGPMDLAALERLAEASGGRVLRPDELKAAAAEVPNRSQTEVFLIPHPLWDTWFTLGLVLFFLTLEWILRKRADLL